MTLSLPFTYLCNDKVVETNSISLFWDSWNVMSVNTPMACDHFQNEMRTIQVPVKFIHSPNNSQRLSLSHWVILFTRQHLFAGVHYRMFHSIIFLHHASTQTFIGCISWKSWFKSGNFKIGSDDSIFLTSFNVLSCSEPHSTLFGAVFFS